MLGWRDLPSQAEGSHPDPFNPPQFIYLILIFHPYFYIFKKKIRLTESLVHTVHTMRQMKPF